MIVAIGAEQLGLFEPARRTAWRRRFEVESRRAGAGPYVVSWNEAGRYYGCSCPDLIFHAGHPALRPPCRHIQEVIAAGERAAVRLGPGRP